MRALLWVSLDVFLTALRHPLYLVYTIMVVLFVVLLLSRSEYSSTFGLVIQWLLVTILIAAGRAIVVLSGGYLRLARVAANHERVAAEWHADGRRSAAAMLRAYVSSNNRVVEETFVELLGPRGVAFVEDKAQSEEDRESARG